MDIQLKKGLLEVCVLAVVEWQDSYGYQIMKDLSACVEDLGIDVVSHLAPFGGERIPDNILCCTQRPSSEILPDNLFGKTAAF